jgi:hypothetical protein
MSRPAIPATPVITPPVVVAPPVVQTKGLYPGR